ncbi:MAG: PIN domain-containing protein, partial [Tepidiformaceae bacterium]
NDYWAISDIVLWELSVLDRQRKISIRLGDSRVRRVIDALTIMPITFDVAQTLHRLDFRSDPADEIIAATSIVNDAPLVTRDARILSSKIVPFAGR